MRITKYMQYIRYVPYVLLWVWTAGAGAQTVYVVPPDTPGHVTNYPYGAWADAATSLHVAVSAALAQGWTNIVVSNGLYEITNEVVITTGIHLRSWNNGAVDPDNTIFDRGGAGRVLQITNAANALVEGVALRNGIRLTSGFNGQGGGVWMDGGMLRNCLITQNRATVGGGVYASGGVIEDCRINDNYTTSNGGGMRLNGADVVVRRCWIMNNIASNAAGAGVYILGGHLLDSFVASNQTIGTAGGTGGGVYASTIGIVSNCAVWANTSYGSGAGYYISAGGGGGIIVDRCRITDNAVTGAASYGGAAYMNGGTLRNSLVSGNSAYRGGGLFFNLNNQVENCTIVSNYASNAGCGINAAGATANFVVNSIIYHNYGVASSNHANAANATWTNNCTAPLTGLTPDSGNFADAPQLVDLAGGDFRLGPGSPCIDAGVNLDWMAGALDLAGRARLGRLTRRVDLGCYESTYRHGMMLGVR